MSEIPDKPPSTPSDRMFINPKSLCIACLHHDLGTCGAGQAQVAKPLVSECSAFETWEFPSGRGLTVEQDEVLPPRRQGAAGPTPYHRKYKGVWLDLYAIARLYDINDPAHFQAFKKIVRLGSGNGGKSAAQDAEEAIMATKDLLSHLRGL